MPDFLPRPDARLLAWTASFDQVVSTSYAELGLSAEQAAQFHAAQQAYAQALAATFGNGTRTPSAILMKDETRAAVELLARVMGAQVRANPSVSDQQRLALGLSVRRNGRRARLPVPAEFPVVYIGERDGNRIRVRVVGSTQTKPAGVKGAMIYTATGDQPPMNIDQWTLAASTTRSINDLQFPSSVRPGTQIWVIAQWYNPTGGCGPASRPVTTYLAGGSVVMKMLQTA